MRRSPFDIWLDLWSSRAKALEATVKSAELAVASREVVGKRLEAVGAACRSPLDGDYVELNRMMTEKVEAFSRAGVSLWRDLSAMQADTQANLASVTKIMLAGRPPTAAEVATMVSRSAAITSRAIAMPGNALAPVHRTATANMHRLRNGKTSASGK